MFILNSLLTGRNRDLDGITCGVIVDGAHTVFQVVLASRCQLIPQPYNICTFFFLNICSL